jgi:hypothetical protein
MELAQDCVEWWVLVLAVLNLPVLLPDSYFNCFVRYEDIAPRLEAFIIMAVPPVKTYGGCMDNLTCIR